MQWSLDDLGSFEQDSWSLPCPRAHDPFSMSCSIVPSAACNVSECQDHHTIIIHRLAFPNVNMAFHFLPNHDLREHVKWSAPARPPPRPQYSPPTTLPTGNYTSCDSTSFS